MKHQSWISDIREGLKELNKDFFYYFNDVTKNQRRIKFFVQYQKGLSIDELFKLQSFIEKRRPSLNVTVKDWSNAPTTGPLGYSGPTYCVYYKPKVRA
jgi:hypothetical protein